MPAAHLQTQILAVVTSKNFDKGKPMICLLSAFKKNHRKKPVDKAKLR